MTYSTGDIVTITIDSFNQHGSCDGILLLNVTLDDGTKYRGRVNINSDDCKHQIMEDFNYELGRKKIEEMEDMRDILLNASYTHEGLMDFVNYVNKDDYSAPF